MKLLALGVFSACFLIYWVPPAWVLPLAAGLLLLVALAATVLFQARQILLGLVLGMSLAALDLFLHFNSLDALQAHEEADGVTQVSGRIQGMVLGESGNYRFRFIPKETDGFFRPSAVQVRWRDAPITPQSGEVWRLPLQMDAREAAPLPGGFDRQRWQFRARLSGTARVVGQGAAIRLQADNHHFEQWRRNLSDRIQASLPSRSEAALIQGITVGNRSGFTQAQWATLNATGTTHLVAISGLHIGLVGGLMLGLGQLVGRLFPGRWPSRILGSGIGLAAAALYAALAGFALPTQRALVMFSVLAFLLLLRRRTGTGNGLALAGVAVLILDPRAVMDPGFYLSFALVALVLLVVSGGDRPGKLSAFVSIQWVTGLAILPVLILLFGLGPISSPVANAIAVPAFSLFVVPISLLGSLAAACGLDTVAAALWSGAASSLAWLWVVLESLAGWPQLQAGDGLALPWLLFGLMATAALVLPGAIAARASLLLALLPALVGLAAIDRSHGSLQHHGLASGGSIWELNLDGSHLIWLDLELGDLDSDLYRWLAQRPGVPILISVGEGLGPARLDRIIAPRQAPVLMNKPSRASPGLPRHCPGGHWEGWYVAGLQADSPCLILGDNGEWWLALDREGLRIQRGQRNWAFPAGDWQGQRIRLKGNGELDTAPRRTYWWRH